MAGYHHKTGKIRVQPEQCLKQRKIMHQWKRCEAGLREEMPVLNWEGRENTGREMLWVGKGAPAGGWGMAQG